MNLPWALGAQHGYSCLVVQVVSVVPSGIKQRQYHPPRDVTSPTCFAVVRWCGIEVGRTPCCRDLSAPTWQHQVGCMTNINVWESRRITGSISQRQGGWTPYPEIKPHSVIEKRSCHAVEASWQITMQRCPCAAALCVNKCLCPILRKRLLLATLIIPMTPCCCVRRRRRPCYAPSSDFRLVVGRHIRDRSERE